jgi:hypothetical protein
MDRQALRYWSDPLQHRWATSANGGEAADLAA